VSDVAILLACSLTGADQVNRGTAWHDILRTASIVRRPLGVTITLPSQSAGALAELIVAEQDCCPFFEFGLAFHGSTIEVTIRVPSEDAIGFLDALVAQDR
jgi:MerR family copper efflux transcriptional regulator